MTRHFPSFPLPAEGETVFSLFTRCKATSGFSADTIVRELTGQKLKSRLIAALPAYLPTMAAKVHKNHPYSDPLNVVRHYSLFPYLSYFMPAPIRTELETKIASTDVTQPIGLGMGLAKYPVNIATAPRYCPSCIEEGIKEEGFPYFRREHQLPGVYICWRHKLPLYHGCKRCGEYPLRNNTFTLAGECNCEFGIEPLPAALVENPPSPSLLWLAEQSAYLLSSSGTRFGNPAAVIGHKAASQASNRHGTVDYRAVAVKIMDFFGDDVLMLLNVKVLTSGQPAPWIRKFFYGDRGHRPTLLYLLLVGAYFDSVSHFEAEGSERAVVKQNAPRKVVNTAGLLKKHRGTLMKLIQETPGLSRGDFQKNAPGAYDFLIRHDKDFFQSQLQRAMTVDAPRGRRIDWAVLDSTKACELEKLFEQEYGKIEKPVFITPTSALRSCRIFEKYQADSSRFPEVTRVLTKSLENRDSFHERRLRWAITEMRRTGTPISANRLRRVADFELKVLHRHRNYILATIQELGADVDDRSFLA